MLAVVVDGAATDALVFAVLDCSDLIEQFLPSFGSRQLLLS